MAYIPEKHKNYNLLPFVRNLEFEVFDYSSNFMMKFDGLDKEIQKELMPYGYRSVSDYLEHVDILVENAKTEEIKNLLNIWKADIIKRNKKEEWSAVRYIGNKEDDLSLRRGNAYYWPTSYENPAFNGIIDGEEFTTYYYEITPEEWEILDDPTGMAKRLLERRL